MTWQKKKRKKEKKMKNIKMEICIAENMWNHLWRVCGGIFTTNSGKNRKSMRNNDRSGLIKYLWILQNGLWKCTKIMQLRILSIQYIGSSIKILYTMR